MRWSELPETVREWVRQFVADSLVNHGVELDAFDGDLLTEMDKLEIIVVDKDYVCLADSMVDTIVELLEVRKSTTPA